MTVEEVRRRPARLLDGRIIREITPIFDTRALGYSSMLVAAKVDASNPQRAARIVNSHPGVSHNYLRTHDFNLWFTIATEPGSRLGLDGTLDVLQRLTGAESIRQLPTLRLFKIRMDLEMEAGTDALAASGVPEERIMELGPRMAAFRGISHCYQRPTYPDWPYSIFTMAHGRSKEECDAILDAIAADHPEIEDRATLYSSTEFKKIRLLYFTDDFRRWEREHAGV